MCGKRVTFSMGEEKQSVIQRKENNTNRARVSTNLKNSALYKSTVMRQQNKKQPSPKTEKVKKSFVRNFEEAVPRKAVCRDISREKAFEEAVSRKAVCRDVSREKVPMYVVSKEENSNPKYKTRYATPELYSSLVVAKRMLQVSKKKNATKEVVSSSKHNFLPASGSSSSNLKIDVGKKLDFPPDEQLYSGLIALDLNNQRRVGPVAESKPHEEEPFNKDTNKGYSDRHVCTAKCKTLYNFFAKSIIPPHFRSRSPPVLPKLPLINYQADTRQKVRLHQKDFTLEGCELCKGRPIGTPGIFRINPDCLRCLYPGPQTDNDKRGSSSLFPKSYSDAIGVSHSDYDTNTTHSSGGTGTHKTGGYCYSERREGASDHRIDGAGTSNAYSDDKYSANSRRTRIGLASDASGMPKVSKEENSRRTEAVCDYTDKTQGALNDVYSDGKYSPVSRRNEVVGGSTVENRGGLSNAFTDGKYSAISRRNEVGVSTVETRGGLSNAFTDGKYSAISRRNEIGVSIGETYGGLYDAYSDRKYSAIPRRNQVVCDSTVETRGDLSNGHSDGKYSANSRRTGIGYKISHASDPSGIPKVSNDEDSRRTEAVSDYSDRTHGSVYDVYSDRKYSTVSGRNEIIGETHADDDGLTNTYRNCRCSASLKGTGIDCREYKSHARAYVSHNYSDGETSAVSRGGYDSGCRAECLSQAGKTAYSHDRASYPSESVSDGWHSSRLPTSYLSSRDYNAGVNYTDIIPRYSEYGAPWYYGRSEAYTKFLKSRSVSRSCTTGRVIRHEKEDSDDYDLGEFEEQ